MLFQFLPWRGDLSKIMVTLFWRYSKQLHTMLAYGQRILHINTLMNIELQCTRPVQSVMHQVVACICLIIKPIMQLQIQIYDFHPRVNSVLKGATVRYFLLAWNKRHICKTRIDHDPGAPFCGSTRYQFYAPNDVSWWKLFRLHNTKHLSSTEI